MDAISPRLQRIIPDDQAGSSRQQDEVSVMSNGNYVVFRSEPDVDYAGYARYKRLDGDSLLRLRPKGGHNVRDLRWIYLIHHL
jgi:hypothetical protein